MAYEIRLIKEHHLVITRFTGIVTDDDLLNHVHQFIKEYPDHDGFLELADLTHADDVKVTIPGIQKLIALEESDGFATASKLAIVAPRNILYGFSRAYQMISETRDHDIHIFPDTKNALKWLGISGVVVD